MTTQFDFDLDFKTLTGHPPFPWQRRLFDCWLSKGKLPPAVDIPTGLGKTAVMALWLLAHARGAPLPRRLVYVVDRRAVVDQATEFAEALCEKLKCTELEPVRQGLGIDEELPISTLRGRYRDNRKWLENPAALAIVVGTVDMVGSRLLFSGYGVSRRMRPYVAGLLGCDTLVMLDEAHLARPFCRMLQTIEKERSDEKECSMFSGPLASQGLPPPFRVLPLSATLCGEEEPFRLCSEDWEHKTARPRLEAKKTLTIENLESGGKRDDSLAEALAERAWKLAQEGTETTGRPPRIAIYCDRRTVAEKAEAGLQKRIKEGGSEAETILFVGGRRVYEREKAAEKLKEYGLIADSSPSKNIPVFLVATSAGEVGVDLDADHMVCDLVAWERMVQRLGRVNRRGAGRAWVLVVDQSPPEEKTSGKDGIARHEAVRKLLANLPQTETGGHDASPAALTRFQKNIAPEELEQASTARLLYPALSRPLVDAWAMTSLAEHTGRPEVAPWLRGWVDEDPQTTVAWRRCLPLRFESFEKHSLNLAPKQDIEAFFEAAPLQNDELLETETWRVVEWLKKRSRKLAKTLDWEGNDVEAADGLNLLQPLDQDTPIAFLLSGSGRIEGNLEEASLSLRKAANLPHEWKQKLAGRRLVVDARLGGIEEGLLSHDCNTYASTIEDNWGRPDATPTLRIHLLKVGDPENHEKNMQKAREIPYLVLPEGKTIVNLIVEKRLDTPTDEDTRAIAAKNQTLDEHQQWAACEATRIADALRLSDDDRALLVAAARHHDDGKGAPRWQDAFNAPREGGPYAKTTRPPNLHKLNGYRHEFQSVLDAENAGLEGVAKTDPRFDLALHLIAAHHGHARPTIAIAGCDSLLPTAAASRAHEIAMRFARLQRQWGPWGLAWWEALLRAADQRASRELDRRAMAEKRTKKNPAAGAASHREDHSDLFAAAAGGSGR